MCFFSNDNILKHMSRAKHKVIVSEDEEDYVDDEVEDTQHMKAYKNFMIGAMKILVNNTDSKAEIEPSADNFQKAADIYIKMSKALMKMEKQAENASKTNNTEDRLNLQDTLYVSVHELQNMTDQHIFPKDPFPVWERYLNEVFEGIPEAQLDLSRDQILTSNADILYLRLLSDYLSQTPLVHIELFIWWTVVEELILHTTAEIRRLHYEYYKTMIVTEGYTPRSLYCTGAVNKLMGMAVSYAIADQNFLTDTKPKVKQMLNNIRKAFERLVRDTTWMDWKTKSSTLEKSQAMRSLIGFPEWIFDQGKLELLYDAVSRLRIFSRRYMEMTDFKLQINLSDTQHLDNMVQLIQLRNVKFLRRWRMKNVLSWDTHPTNVNAFHAFQDNAISKYDSQS